MNKDLLTAEVQSFIYDNEKTDIHDLVLRGVRFKEVSSAQIAEQIHGLRTLRAKAEDMIKPGIIFPPKLNLEQSSSARSALYKRKLLPKDCIRFIDLTGGFGIDCFFMSDQIEDVTYCETNEELAAIVNHNFSVLDRQIKVIPKDGVMYLHQSDKRYDCIYLDPSRRKGTKKIISLDQSEPNLLFIWEELLNHARRVIVKLSPMLDLDYLLNHLQGIQEIHVVSVKQDVKELVLVAQKDVQKTASIIATSLQDDHQLTYVKKKSLKELSCVTDITQYHFIYEPFSVLLKAGLQDEYTSEFGLDKVDPNTHLYLSESLVSTPMCKQFEIISETKIDSKSIEKLIQEKRLNVVCRNFPLQPEEVLKKLKMKQGGQFTLLCFRQSGETKAVLAKRITK